MRNCDLKQMYSKYFRPILLISVIWVNTPATIFTLNAQDAPFKKGVNLTEWFQAATPRQIQFTKYTKQDFANIKSLGCDVVRLPINLHYMTNGAPNYTLDPLFLQFLDKVVDWAEELGLHLILDNHTFDPAVNTSPNVGSILEKVWVQMAQHYKNRSMLIYYEIMNEPHGISDAAWNNIQQQVVKKIREIDKTHTIIVGPAEWNSFHNLKFMPVYDESNLIYTFHFYDPFIFTHQGATWVDQHMAKLKGVPFPYNAPRMPAFPTELRNTWIESAFNDYQNTGKAAYVKSMLDVAVAFRDQRKVPIFCGEFGVYIPNSPPTDRVDWYKVVVDYLNEKKIGWTAWDYHGGFGLYKENGQGLFNHDLNVPLLEAMSLQVPTQTPYIQQPEKTGFMIYDDYVGEKLVSDNIGNGALDFYSQDDPNNGQYCISWTGSAQYNSIAFNFRPVKDMAALVAGNYALDFIVRGSKPGYSFDVRFLDTHTTSPGDLPWRIRFTINESKVPMDSKWHHVHIPLKQFAEQGAWDGNWHNPRGEFDWSKIDKLEIVNEHGPLGDGKIWLDNIHITNVDTAKVWVSTPFPNPNEEEPIVASVTDTEQTFTVYPNPFQHYLKVTANRQGIHHLRVYSTMGQLVARQPISGVQLVSLGHLPQGLYIAEIIDTHGEAHKMKVVKR